MVTNGRSHMSGGQLWAGELSTIRGRRTVRVKHSHEVRDPIHVFIRLDSDERAVLDSPFVQRLRHIHQLSMGYLVYPGATHRRFEHSLGVMEVATRIFDVVTDPANLPDDIRALLPEIATEEKRRYWRRVIRMAALCHDIGHLPFSHAAEKELLPTGWSHEHLTLELIKKMDPLWRAMTPPLRTNDVLKIAVGPKKLSNERYSDGEAILSEIIVGDALGADRIDYLLRDSYHAGVAYGRFDHYRLIDTMRILPKGEGDSREPKLGVEIGGLPSAEALLLARYFMYAQVYCHPVRRAYDMHLEDFLGEWLEGGRFSTDPDEHARINDCHVVAALLEAAQDPRACGHEPAARIVKRRHYRLLYERNPEDLKVSPEAGRVLFEAAKDQFGVESVRHDSYVEKGVAVDFPVRLRDGRVISSLAASTTISSIPVTVIDYLFMAPEKLEEASKWIHANRGRLLNDS